MIACRSPWSARLMHAFLECSHLLLTNLNTSISNYAVTQMLCSCAMFLSMMHAAKPGIKVVQVSGRYSTTLAFVQQFHMMGNNITPASPLQHRACQHPSHAVMGMCI